MFRSVFTGAFMAAILAAGQAQTASCSIEKLELPGEAGFSLGKEFEGYVKGQIYGEAHDFFGKLAVDYYVERLEGATRGQDVLVFSTGKDLAEYARSSAHFIKIATVAKALEQGTYDEIGNMVFDEASEKLFEAFLSEIGATSNGTLVGILISTLKGAKESFDELAKVDCETHVDVAYYGFTEQPRLRWAAENRLPGDAVDFYVRNYLFGGGKDASGGDRGNNRRALQCFINYSMPESERVDITSVENDDGAMSSFTSFMNIFAKVGGTLGTSADLASGNERLRLPVTVMLRDFNHRLDIDEAAEEVRRLRNSEEFRRFEATLEVMNKVPEIEEWLCDKLKVYRRVGSWVPTITAELPAVSAGQSLELPPPLAFPVDEDGTISHHYRDGQADVRIEGTFGEDGLRVTYEIIGFDDDAGWVPVANVEARGSFVDDTLLGTYEGVGFLCATPEKGCPPTPVKGTWTAQRLPATAN